METEKISFDIYTYIYISFDIKDDKIQEISFNGYTFAT